MQVSLLEVIQDVHIQPEEHPVVRKATLRRGQGGEARKLTCERRSRLVPPGWAELTYPFYPSQPFALDERPSLCRARRGVNVQDHKVVMWCCKCRAPPNTPIFRYIDPGRQAAIALLGKLIDFDAHIPQRAAVWLRQQFVQRLAPSASPSGLPTWMISWPTDH